MSSTRVTRPNLQVSSIFTFLDLLEPVGGSSPKFSGDQTIRVLSKASSMPLDLICPAQGSPVPAHRFVHPSRSSLAEPVGGSAPKFSTDLTTSGVKRSSNAPFSLSCPAQGSPVPAYRLYLILVFSEPVGGSSPKFSTDVTRSDVQRSSFVSFSLSCPAQGSPVPAFRFLFSKHCIFFRAGGRLCAQIPLCKHNLWLFCQLGKQFQPSVSSPRITYSVV